MTGKFYKKSNLRISGILKLIRVWECEVGESFLDYCSFGKSNCEEFLDFLKDKYEVVYDFVTENYHEESANLDKLLGICSNYFCQDFLNTRDTEFFDSAYELGMYIVADFIYSNEEAWDTLKEFFTTDEGFGSEMDNEIILSYMKNEGYRVH